MRGALVCVVLAATTAIAAAEAQPQPQAAPRQTQVAPRQAPAQRASDQGQQAQEPVPRPAKVVQDTVNDHGRQLTACFTSTKPPRKISMIVVVASDGAKTRSRVKQSTRATKQIEACVVNVFDHIAFKLPPRAVTVELPVAYDPAGV
jgi:hypothetical protein